MSIKLFRFPISVGIVPERFSDANPLNFFEVTKKKKKNEYY